MSLSLNESMKTEHKSIGTVKVVNDSYYSHGPKEYTSEIFCSTTNENVKWRIKVNITWQGSGGYFNSISPSVCLVSAKYESTVRARCTLFLLQEGRKLYVDEIALSSFVINQPKKWPGTCSNTLCQLINSRNSFTMECVVIEFPNVADNVIATKKIIVKKCDVIDDLNVLFRTKEWSDVTIVAKGPIEFEAHKSILAARSPIFAAMFRTTMVEQKTNRIEITDIQSKVIEEMLRFIYTGRVNNMPEIAMELLAAADKYNLERLKQMCEAQLGDTLRVENAAHILTIADHHDCEQLKELTKGFIANNIKAVMNTKGYDTMIESQIQLAEEILHVLVFRI